MMGSKALTKVIKAATKGKKIKPLGKETKAEGFARLEKAAAKAKAAKSKKRKKIKEAIAKGDKTVGKYNKKIYDNKLAGVSDPKKRQLALSMGKGGPKKVKAVYAAQDAIRKAAKEKGMKVKAFRKKYPNNKNVKALYKLKPNIKLDDMGDKGFRVYGGH